MIKPGLISESEKSRALKERFARLFQSKGGLELYWAVKGAMKVNEAHG